MTRIVMLSRAGRESLPTDLLHDLEREHDLTVLQRRDAPTPHETIRILADADVLATTNVTLPPLTPMTLARLPRLREVVLYATGYEHVDLPLLRSHGVSLTTLPEYATRAVAEHALALLLSQTTRLHLANDKARGLAPDDVSLRGTELHSSTVAVVGVGRIGSEVARLLQALGVSVIGVDPDPAAQRTARLGGIRVAPLEQALSEADHAVVCASTIPGAPPVLDERALYSLRRGAFVCNIGRPALVNRDVMRQLLLDGHVRGYAVDDIVASSNDPLDELLITEGRLLQTAHSAWWRDEVLHRGARMFGEAIQAAADAAPQSVTIRTAGAAR